MRRAIDILVGAVLLVLLAPVLALAAIAVKLSSKGPVLYSGKRVGLGGKIFGMHKFRTMVVGADSVGPGVTSRDDPRVTRIGRLLRASKMDELPQLWNLVKGDMTLVGPRPEAPAYVAHYTTRQRRLLEVRPGLTGPAQLHYTVEEEQRIVDPARADEIYIQEIMNEKLELDLSYLETRTPAQDVKAFFGTIALVVTGSLRALGRFFVAAEGSGEAGGAEASGAAHRAESVRGVTSGRGASSARSPKSGA